MSTTPDIIGKDFFVLPEEKFLLTLKDKRFSKKLVLVPWRTLNKTNNLHLVSFPKAAATILGFSWSMVEVNKTITSQLPSKVFCTSYNKSIELTQIPFPHFVEDDVVLGLKSIFLSFVGWKHGEVRAKLATIYKNRENFLFREKFHRNKPDHRKEFINTLAISRFSLCPRGVGSGSYRFWESLKAGAIPILISDEYQLPKGWDWKNTIIRLAEKDLNYKHKIDAEINKNLHREDILRKNCLAAYNFFLNPENLCKYINTQL